MGGKSDSTWLSKARSALNFATVFTFVALWHDISLNLLVWGWLIVFFMMPEVIAGWVFPPRKWEDRPTAYRVICGIGAVGNLMMMMMANLVGFAVGIDGLKSIIHGIFRDFSGLFFLLSPIIPIADEANDPTRSDLLGRGLSGAFCGYTGHVRSTAGRGAEGHFPQVLIA